MENSSKCTEDNNENICEVNFRFENLYVYFSAKHVSVLFGNMKQLFMAAKRTPVASNN